MPKSGRGRQRPPKLKSRKLSAMVLHRIKNAMELWSSVQAYKDDLAEAIDERYNPRLQPGEMLPDYALLLVLAGRPLVDRERPQRFRFSTRLFRVLEEDHSLGDAASASCGTRNAFEETSNSHYLARCSRPRLDTQSPPYLPRVARFRPDEQRLSPGSDGLQSDEYKGV